MSHVVNRQRRTCINLLDRILIGSTIICCGIIEIAGVLDGSTLVDFLRFGTAHFLGVVDVGGGSGLGGLLEVGLIIHTTHRAI